MTSRRKRVTYAGGGNGQPLETKGIAIPGTRVKESMKNMRSYSVPYVSRSPLCVFVLLSLVATCYGLPHKILINHKDLQPQNLANWNQNNVNILPEIVKHPYDVVVEEKWDNNYCDNTSAQYTDLTGQVIELFELAAQTGGLSNEYQRLDNIVVFPANDPTACDTRRSSPKKKVEIPLHLMPKRRNKRAVPLDDLVVVKGDVVMLQTDNYNPSTGDELEEAVKNYIKNSNSTLNITIDADTVNVGEAEDKLCGVDVNCDERSKCITEMDQITGAKKGKCQCLPQYDDVSPDPSKNPGEICADRCTRGFCSNAGTCIRNPTFFTRSCRCDTWRLGDTCSVNMNAALIGSGIVIGVLFIALLTVLLSFFKAKRKRDEMSFGRENVRPPTPTPQIRSIYRIPQESDELHIETDTPPSVHRIPRPLTRPTLRQEHSYRRPTVAEQPPPLASGFSRSQVPPQTPDPSSDPWFLSRNIPRPHFSADPTHRPYRSSI